MSKTMRDEKLPQSSLSFLPHESVRAFTDALSSGVLLVDAEGVVYHINQAARLLHQGGSIPKTGFPLADASPHDWVEVRKVLATGIPQICSLLRLPMATVVVSRMPLEYNGVTAGVITMMQAAPSSTSFPNMRIWRGNLKPWSISSRIFSSR